MAKKKTKHKQTPTQKAYYKERKRIQQFLSRARKRGYVFEDNVLPSIPKNITQASVNRLKNITPKQLYRQSFYVRPETGEAITGLQGRNLERAASAKKSIETRKQKIISKMIERQLDDMYINELHPWDEDVSELPYSYTQPEVDKWAEIGRRLKDEFPKQIMVVSRKGGKGKGYFVDANGLSNELYNIWRNTDDEIGDRQALNRYVDANEAEFAQAIAEIAIYSDDDLVITHDNVLSNSVTKLANFLNYGRMLTQNEAENLDWIGSYYNTI